ncbi:MAG: hydroxymethylglutaryl-CoA lyase [Gammaproteobacteria bacterium]|jgi:hydroxymethylglutaryl-CoA lyase|nr:hydroxymethylglutaryl-CoA lyase [Gammaproteobacteria bacterium]|tara:strand:- start:758 stop:1663 length:906 start_codon:yes stop_codon:yes gene_type:complete
MNPDFSSVTVMEVSPRDGLQNEDTLLTTEQKLQLVDYAIEAGCKRIEVTSFVHPKRVPQMSDAEAVCAGLPERADVRYTGLILNDRGYQRLRDTKLHEAGLVVPASDTFGEKNQGLSVAQGLSMATEIIADGKQSGFPVQVTISVAFGCPFEGEVPLSRIQSMAETLAAAGPVEIALADTIGVGVPMRVAEAFMALKQQLANMPLRAHFHDTRNTGIANAYAALMSGVDVLDASIGGIGGCPFAPNASGNIATEDLLYMLNRGGVEHGVDIHRLIDGASWLETVLGKSVPSMLLKAGGFPA